MVFLDFDASIVHRWVQDHPVLIEELKKKWENEEEKESGDNNDTETVTKNLLDEGLSTPTL